MQHQLLRNNQSIPDWQKQITHIINDLEAVLKQSEKDFLLVGEKLNDYKKRSDWIINESIEVSGWIKSPEVLGQIIQLKDRADGLLGYLKNDKTDRGSSLDVLSAVIDLLDKANDNLGGFKKIVKTLKMLSISTQIETARLGNNDSGFTALANDVEKLSVDIDDKTVNIVKRTTDLRGFINITIGKNQNLGGKQKQQTEQIVAELNTNIISLLEKNETCSNTAVSISGLSKQIKEDINLLVTDIQFHDITRQQMEHILTSLKEVYDYLGKAERCEAGSEDYIKNISLARDLVTLETNQLNNSSGQFGDAVTGIKESLKNIQRTVIRVIGDTQNLTACANLSGSSFVDELLGSLGTIETLINENNDIGKELLESLQRVGDTVKELATFIHLIEEIGEEVELIAINASIKAAHTGNEGAALGVIADTIQKLSAEALDQTAKVSEPFKSITMEAEKLLVDNADAEAEEMYVDAARTMKENVTSIKTGSSRVNDSLIKIQHAINQLKADIEVLTNGLMIHQRLASVVNSAEKELYHLVSLFKEITGNYTAEENREIIERISRRYTMLSERKVHESFKEHAFGYKSNYEEDYSEQNSGSEFGDNVELF